MAPGALEVWQGHTFYSDLKRNTGYGHHCTVVSVSRFFPKCDSQGWGAIWELPGNHWGARARTTGKPPGNNHACLLSRARHWNALCKSSSVQSPKHKGTADVKRITSGRAGPHAESCPHNDSEAPSPNQADLDPPQDCKSDAEKEQILPCLGPDLGGSYRILQGSSL